MGKCLFPLLLATARNAWKDRLVSVKVDASGFIVFQFRDEHAKQSVLDEGPWFFSRKYLVLKNWHRMMKPSKEHPSKIPIWVKIIDLPWELWNKECISRIASTFGRPIHVDQATAKKTKTSHARVCVEIDAKVDLPDDVAVTVGGVHVVVPIQYQVLPPLCTKCKVFGHTCRISPPPVVTQTEHVEDAREKDSRMAQSHAPLEVRVEKEDSIAIVTNPPVEEWQIIGKAAAIKKGGITALEAVTQFVPAHTNTTKGDPVLDLDEDTHSESLDEEFEVLDGVVPPKVVKPQVQPDTSAIN